MRILEFTASNFMRLSVVQITPEGHIIEITGENGAGKSSCLNAIWAALGGKEALPEKPIRNGKKSARVEVKIGDDPKAPMYTVELSITEKGSYLKVLDAEGSKFKNPQTILTGLWNRIGYDPLEFMRMEAKDQFKIVRRLVALDEILDALDRKRTTIFDNRTVTNRDLERAKAVASAITVPDDLPETEPDIAAITDRLTGASEHNAFVAKRIAEIDAALAAKDVAVAEVARLEALLAEASERRRAAEVKADEMARLTVPAVIDATAVRAELDAANTVKEGFARQARKIDADASVTTLQREADEATAAIAAIDKQKADAIAGAKMPVEGLGFTDGTVTFNGLPLAQASSAEQLRVSASIGAALNPALRVLLARDGSLLDKKSMKALAEFAAEKDLQIWVEKVDESGEVGVVIEDGHVKGREDLVALQELAERGETTERPATDAPDEAAQSRATAYLEGQLVILARCKSAEDADKLNAEAKIKLRRFPEMLASQWTAAYLSRVKSLHGKK
jgi:hypothetical protein